MKEYQSLAAAQQLQETFDRGALEIAHITWESGHIRIAGVQNGQPFRVSLAEAGDDDDRIGMMVGKMTQAQLNRYAADAG